MKAVASRVKLENLLLSTDNESPLVRSIFTRPEKESTLKAQKTIESPTLSSSQMNWMISQGYAWENPRNDGGAEDEFLTAQRVYVWVTPSAGHLEGHYEAIA